MYLFTDQFQELVQQICNRISLSSNKNFKNINILWQHYARYKKFLFHNESFSLEKVHKTSTVVSP